MNKSYSRYEIIDLSPFPTKTLNPSFFPSSLFPHDVLVNPITTHPALDFPSPFDPFVESVTDVVQIETTPFCSYNRLVRRQTRVNSSELYIRELCDRVSALESKFDKLLEVKKAKKMSELDRKYSWTAEIKGGVDRKFKWTAEIEGKKGERKYEWRTEVKGNDDEKKVYTWKATIGGEKKKEKKVKKDAEKGSSAARIVEIEEPMEHRSVVLRQVYILML